VRPPLSFLRLAFLLGFVVPGDARATTPPAETGSLEIVAVDAATGAPIPFAHLVRIDGTAGFLAGADGVFRVADLAAGSWRGVVSHVAYQRSGVLEIRIVAGETTRFRVELPAAGRDLPSVEVRAKRDSGERPPTGARKVHAADVSPLPNPADDVFQLIRHVPGVSSNDIGSEFQVRGGSVDETLVRIDGLEVRQLFHGPDFGGITGILPLSVVESIDVYTGGFPARYGGRLSGVLDLELRSDGPRGLHGAAAADGVAARLLAEYHSNPASLLVSVREGYLDRVLGAVQEEAVIQPGYRDLLLRSIWRPHPSSRVSLNYLRSEDHTLYEDGIESHYIDSDRLEHLLWGTARVELGERGEVRGMAYRTRMREVRTVDIAGQDDQASDRAGARLEASFPLPARHQVTIGGQLDREWGRYDLVSREVVSATLEGEIVTNPIHEARGLIDRTRVAAFAEDEWNPVDRLGLNLGVRVSRGPFDDSLRVDPRMSAALGVGGGVTFRGAWGVYEQPAEVRLDGTGLHDVPHEETARSRHLVVGAEKAFGTVRLGVDAYDKALRGLHRWVTRTVDGVVELQPITRGRARGVEVFLQRASATSNWWIAYAVGRSAWGNARRTYVRDFDRLHSFSIANTFQISSDWDLGMSYAVHTGTPYTTQSWARREDSGTWALSEGVPNGARLPAYQRLDVRIRRHFHFEHWRMSVYAEALNLTNHDNVIWYSWGFREGESGRTPYRIARTGLPSIPSLGLEIQF